MDTMKQEEVRQLLNDNPHLKEYLTSIQLKMGAPVFYSKVPRELLEEAYPNIIWDFSKESYNESDALMSETRW
jgi:hypothetical protein